MIVRIQNKEKLNKELINNIIYKTKGVQNEQATIFSRTFSFNYNAGNVRIIYWM